MVATRLSRFSNDLRVSKGHLMKVVFNLSKKGFICSKKGRQGGMSLAVCKTRIIIGDVVRAVEPSFGLADCGDCGFEPSCLLKETFSSGVNAMLNAFDQFSLADVTRNQAQLIKLLERNGS